jgi:hypothetical protein
VANMGRPRSAIDFPAKIRPAAPQEAAASARTDVSIQPNTRTVNAQAKPQGSQAR